MRISRLAVGATLTVVGALALLALGALIALDAGIGGATLVRTAAARTHHPIDVRGELRMKWLTRQPRIEATDVTVGNPAWMPEGILARLDRVTITLEPSLFHPLRVKGVELQGGELHAQRLENGASNWSRSPPSEPPQPAGTGLPAIRGLQLANLRLRIEDAPRHLDFTGTVATSAREHGQFGLDAEGTLNGRPVRATVTGEPLASVVAGKPWKFHYEERSSGTTLVADGHVPRPFDLQRIDARFESRGNDLADLWYVAGVKLPDTVPYQLTGHARRDGQRFEFSDLAFKARSTDVTGRVTLDRVKARRHVDAELHSAHASLEDIGKGAAGRAPPRKGPKKLFADWDFPLEGLRKRDGTIRYEGEHVEVGPLTLENLAVTLKLDGGILTADPLTARDRGGSGHGRIVFDARRKEPHADVRLTSDGLDVGRLLRGKGPTPPVSGPLRGVLTFESTGDSFGTLFAAGSGRLRLAMPEGQMRTSLAKLVQLDLTALGLKLTKDDDRVAIRCAVVEADATRGQAKIGRIVIDAEPVVLTGSGSLALDSEAVDVSLTPAAKHPGLRLKSPLHVTGTILEPSPRLQRGGLGKQGIAAVALGTVLTPLAAAAAFVDPGKGEDQDCAALLAAMKD